MSNVEILENLKDNLRISDAKIVQEHFAEKGHIELAGYIYIVIDLIEDNKDTEAIEFINTLILDVEKGNL